MYFKMFSANVEHFCFSLSVDHVTSVFFVQNTSDLKRFFKVFCFMHNSDVTCAIYLRCLRSLASQVIVKKFVWAMLEKTSKVCITGTYWISDQWTPSKSVINAESISISWLSEGIHWSPVDSLTKCQICWKHFQSMTSACIDRHSQT